jgi:exonuclease VII small subunit
MSKQQKQEYVSMKQFIRAFVVFGLLLALAGCASKGIGISEAALSGDPLAMAAEGAKLNNDGAKLVQDAEKRLVEGRKQVRDGEAQVQDGSTRVTNARFEYKDLSEAGGKAKDPDAVSKEAKKLKAAGKRWEDAIETIKKGNTQISKGNKTIEKAQADIRKGRQMMERGSVLVRNSARTRLDTDLLVE